MRIPLFKIYHDSKDVESITSSIKRGMQWAAGPNIEKFETLISKKVGRKYTVVFNSGTSALHALLLAYNIKSGDEVIVPSFSFIATANAPLFVGAKPVFADIEKLTVLQLKFPEESFAHTVTLCFASLQTTFVILSQVVPKEIFTK